MQRSLARKLSKRDIFTLLPVMEAIVVVLPFAVFAREHIRAEPLINGSAYEQLLG